jgi:hypothetical protein
MKEKNQAAVDLGRKSAAKQMGGLSKEERRAYMVAVKAGKKVKKMGRPGVINS